jgi:hypothetical protein
MGSGVGAGAMLTGLELGNPGGGTPPSTAGETPAATDDRFMGRRFLAGARLADPAWVLTQQTLSGPVYADFARSARARASSAASP